MFGLTEQHYLQRPSIRDCGDPAKPSGSENPLGLSPPLLSCSVVKLLKFLHVGSWTHHGQLARSYKADWITLNDDARAGTVNKTRSQDA